MLRLQKGDDVAFEDLMTQYSVYVKSVAISMVSSEHDAMDVVQEVFMRVLSSRESYRPTASFTSWLRRITRNLVLNRLRKEQSRRAVSLSVVDENAVGGSKDYYADSFRAIEKGEDSVALMDAIRTLGRRQREVIRLYYMEGKSCNSVAEEMSATNSAVKALLSRARHQLRLKLQPTRI